MLIKSLFAYDFRKYKELKIDNIPENGVISVSGANESGKTSMGEVICFALFNRTFALDEKNIRKLVRWGQDDAKVGLTFLDDDGESYIIKREIKKSGAMSVSLQNTKKDAIVINGEENVKQALEAIIAFDYAAFSSSFYLGQRELTTPDPNSFTIKQMAGIGDFARISDELVTATNENKATLQEVEPQHAELQTQIDAINLDETWLPELVEADEALEAEQRQKAGLMGKLKQDIDSYAGNSGPFKMAKRLRGLFGFLALLLLPILLIAWAVWGILKYSPETILKLSNIVSAETLSTFSVWADSWLLTTAIGSLVAFLISYLIKRASSSKMRDLNETSSEFSRNLNEAHQHVTTEVDTLLPERVVQLVQQRNDKDSLLVLPPREQFSNIGQLVDTTEDYHADTEELVAAVGRIEDVLQKQDTEIKQHSKNLQADIVSEKERSEAAGGLRVELKQFEKVIKACEHNIKVQDTGVGMLKRSAKESIESFNNNIAKISARTLPKFTEGRYHKLKIDEDLDVQVFSDNKEGYMDFDEISSGTQRQIMLALRMAMSEELAKNSGNDKQFIFLDEPFAFFDQWRTKASLKALPEVSDVITQVWVVAQEFPDDSGIDLIIDCPIDSDILVV